ncbi:MAG: N5-glutamine methyltransferase, modifies release factors RF-1 and RF-2 [uncultured bacterium]|nr:MAG: N5-glutamine methyltransferase, modifies release factors RF-1 and RF-2 [uncultured bacterium]
MLTIQKALSLAAAEFTSISDTERLDAEILLAHVLQVDRSYLLAFPERILTSAENIFFEKLVAERKSKMPVAYIVGYREFWSLNLKVTPDTLIPRPETELLVEHALKEARGEKNNIADLGTGSGAIALAIAHERPDFKVYATDKSLAALNIAKENAMRLNIQNVVFYEGDWCFALPKIKFDGIISNPPYIAQGDPHFQQNDVHCEPASALMAGENGLSDLCRIIREAKSYLKTEGFIMLEHGFLQAEAVRMLLAHHGYVDIHSYRDLAGHERVTRGRIAADVWYRI